MSMVMIIMSSRLKIKNSTLSLFYDLSLELWLMPPKSTLYAECRLIRLST